MKNLSVVLATFNEEKNIGACLESLKDLAGEIIVVDGTSSDRTVEIAKKFGAKVKVTTNKPNFHINKQMAIDMARGEWILQLDADERVSKELAKEIKLIVNGQLSHVNGYWMPRKNYFLGRFLMKGGQYPDYTLRLYRKGKGKLPQKDVHEQAVVEGEVGYMENALLHYPYENFKSYLQKWNRYNDFISEQLRDEQENKNTIEKSIDFFLYLFIRPVIWFLTTLFRHKGFMDGWQGLTFSFFSALRFPVAYVKYLGFLNFSLILILLLAVFMRVFNFNLRWEMAGDDSRDALIALEALKRHQWPLTGSFSSAGPFVFGGLFYWFIMISYILLPGVINAPWIFTAIVGILTVFAIIKIGKEIGGLELALIIGLLGATAPQLVARSVILGQHTFLSTFSILAVMFILLLWRTKKYIFAFLAGGAIGLGLNFHYQALNLLIFFPALFFIPGLSINRKIVSASFMIVGFLIPLLPLLIWDSHQSFANYRNVADYFLIGQYRIYVPNSWRLFIFQALPGYWSFVEGRYPIIAILASFVIPIVFIYSWIIKKIPSRIIFLGLIFFILLFLNRYYRGERSESYLLYFIPFILVLTSWGAWVLIKSKNSFLRFTGILFLGTILIGNFIGDFETLSFRGPYPYLRNGLNSLYNMYPGTKFEIYDYKYKNYAVSMPISLIMSFDGKEDPGGKKVAISCLGKGCPGINPPVINNKQFFMVDLGAVPGEQFANKTWINVDQARVYDDLVGWLSKNQLKSNFSLSDYIKRRVGI